MKKFLAICSVILSVCATFTACGSADKSDTSNRDNSAVTDDKKDSRTNDKDMGDRIDDAVDGAGRAGNDLIGGATDAIDDVIDGIDGNDNNNDHKRSSKTTDKKSR